MSEEQKELDERFNQTQDAVAMSIHGIFKCSHNKIKAQERCKDCEIDYIKQSLSEAVGLLKELEYFGRRDIDGEDVCRFCGGSGIVGHFKDCKLSNFMKKV